jgi:hypothetical protein
MLLGCLLLVTLLGAGGLGWRLWKSAPLTPEERVRRSVAFSSRKVPNTEKGLVNRRYKCFLRVVAPDEVLNEIDRVTYDFGAPGKKWFPDGGRFTQVNRADGFEMGYYTDVGLCNWEMDVILQLRDGKQVTLKCNMYEVRQH